MRGRPFEDGNPGGPGRPKGSHVNLEAKKWAETAGMRLLLRLADGKEKGWGRSCRWDAVKLALAYGIGKPREAIEITAEQYQQPEIDMSWATLEQVTLLAGLAYCPAECCTVAKTGKAAPHLEVPWEKVLNKNK